jgi:hypothetical protein
MIKLKGNYMEWFQMYTKQWILTVNLKKNCLIKCSLQTAGINEYFTKYCDLNV